MFNKDKDTITYTCHLYKYLLLLICMYDVYMYDVYISKRQCMRDTGSDECQILYLPNMGPRGAWIFTYIII
jgi:hypothetical protein